MKKSTIFAAMIMATVSMSSANYITLGDDVRINPRYLDGYYKVTSSMHIEGMCDDWQMWATYPDGITVKLVSGIVPLAGMTVTYTDRFGTEQTYEAPLQVSAAYSTIASHIAVQGYWDYDEDGYYDPYGTAKWMPGDYEMFDLNLYVGPAFRSGDIILDGTLTSGTDQRGAVLQGVRFYKRSHLWVGYMPGDVTGDEKINIGDATLLISIIINDAYNELDEFQMAAADFNGDGEVNITDAVLITNDILNK